MYVITLEIAGKMLTSEELAERIEKLTKDYPTTIQMGSSYSLTVIDNLRAELSKYKTEIKDKILVLINQLIIHRIQIMEK